MCIYIHAANGARKLRRGMVERKLRYYREAHFGPGANELATPRSHDPFDQFLALPLP